MSAIAGVWSPQSDRRAERACRSLLESQRPFGRDDVAMALQADFACGRNLHFSVPEDIFDRQPERSTDGRFWLVADVRLDNRDEIIALLGRSLGDRRETSDSRLLFELLLHSGERALDLILGDFAFGFWDSREKILKLARDPLGERALHFARFEDGLVFSSMPQALARLLGAQLDEHRLACRMADLPSTFRGTFFKGVEKVQPGQLVTLSPHGRSERIYWDPPGGLAHSYSPQELGEALREQLDAAVARRLRRFRGGVAAHLSSGLDSSAVATSAAILLGRSGETLHAFTSAPRTAVSDAPPGWHLDEAEIAARTAALHPNIEHHVVRPENPILDLDEDHDLAGYPVGSVFNNAWWSEINARASNAGATVLLTGEVGNFTWSAGLVWDDLAQLLARREFTRWWSEVRALRRNNGWGTALRMTAQPFLPPWVRRVRSLLTGANTLDRWAFVSENAKRQLRSEAAQTGWDSISQLTGVERRLAFLRLVDPALFRNRSLARWGIEERDATADRRLAEFCLSLPIEARLMNGVRRPALRRALEGRVAGEVYGKTRGLQSADWQARLGREELESFVASLMSRSRDHAVDWAAVNAAVRSWPPHSSGDNTVFYRFSSLLRTLSAVHFGVTYAGPSRRALRADPPDGAARVRVQAEHSTKLLPDLCVSGVKPARPARLDLIQQTLVVKSRSQ